ncbi:MAG: hypothetical protein IT484_07605 [Gammaproteobacteria bacterium]|nr:hypothetical protein [Gammaproteobacteria bacterium]
MIQRGLVATFLLCGLASAQTRTPVVWQIGQADRSFRDLANAGNIFGGYPAAFPADVTFDIGRSDAAKDFSASHPGPVDQWAGGRTHPFRIRFDLKDKPARAYLLAIDVVDTQSQFAPVLHVRVNDQHADVPLERGVGDISAIHPEKGKPRSLKFTVPGDLLKPQGNVVELTVTSGSWILYDALSLSVQDAGTRPALEAEIQPTVFLTEKDGHLGQECVVRAKSVLSSEPVILFVAGGDQVNPYRFELGRAQLGQLTARVSIPAADVAREVPVRINVGDQFIEMSLHQEPVKKWFIYVAPSTHTDIGYTDFQDRVIQVHNRNTDLAIQLAGEYPLYHWNLESSWAAQMWLRDNPWTRKQLLDASRNRRIGIEAGYLNMLTGLCSHEELIRNMYYTASLARTHEVPFESLTLTDAPSHVWSVPSVLAGAGIKYLSCGVNQTRAPLFKKGINQKAPFWWEGPDGGRVLTWLADGYSQAEAIGLKGGVQHMREVVENFMHGWNRRTDYPYDAILLHGAYSDNVTAGREIAETITQYAQKYAYPRVILAGNKDFFEHVETRFADKIPVVRGCGGSWWEDGAASTAYETDVNRLAHERIAAAEAAWAVLKTMDARSQVSQQRISAVWDNILLYDEHTWGAYNSITAPTSDFVARQWSVKADYARQADLESRRLLDEALHGIATKAAVANAVFVFNAAGCPRSGVVQVEIPKGTVVTDGTKPLPQQILDESLLNTATVAVRAGEVPALGYRACGLSRLKLDQAPTTARVDGRTIENEFYRVTLDEKSGGVRSILDKKRGKELVDAASPYHLGQVIYAHGGDEKGQTQVMCPNPAGVKLYTSGEARIERGRAGAVFSSLRSIGKVKCFPHVGMEVVLYEHEPRIDVNMTLQKEMTFDKEAVYIAFPFAGANPKFRYEIGGAAVRPNEDHWPGGCRDWFSIQRWLTLQTDDGAIAWSSPDAPLVQLCEPQAGKWLDELKITNGTVLAYAMNNYWFTNYKAGQDGRFTFRYSLAGGDSFDAAQATRFGQAVQQPLWATVMGGDGAKAGSSVAAGFCEVSPGVELSCVKPAEDGRGVIIRVHETGGRPTDARVIIKLAGVRRATACDLVERDGKPIDLTSGSFTVPLKAFGTQTIRLE